MSFFLHPLSVLVPYNSSSIEILISDYRIRRKVRPYVLYIVIVATIYIGSITTYVYYEYYLILLYNVGMYL